MRPIALSLLVALAGCGGGGADPARTPAANTATGPTARVQTARDRAAHRRAANRHTLLGIPGIGRVVWRYDPHERFVTVLEVPAGGATESVSMTVAGRLVKIGDLDPGDQAEAGPVRGGPVDIRVVQSTEPATVIATIRVVYSPRAATLSAAPLVIARVRTRSHGRP